MCRQAEPLAQLLCRRACGCIGQGCSVLHQREFAPSPGLGHGLSRARGAGEEVQHGVTRISRGFDQVLQHAHRLWIVEDRLTLEQRRDLGQPVLVGWNPGVGAEAEQIVDLLLRRHRLDQVGPEGQAADVDHLPGGGKLIDAGLTVAPLTLHPEWVGIPPALDHHAVEQVTGDPRRAHVLLGNGLVVEVEFNRPCRKAQLSGRIAAVVEGVALARHPRAHGQRRGLPAVLGEDGNEVGDAAHLGLQEGGLALLLPHQHAAVVAGAKDLPAQQAQDRQIGLIHEDHHQAVVGEQVAGDQQAGQHERQPGGLGAVVFVHEAAAGVVGRVDQGEAVAAVSDPAQFFQRVKIIALDQGIAAQGLELTRRGAGEGICLLGCCCLVGPADFHTARPHADHSFQCPGAPPARCRPRSSAAGAG